MSFKEEFFKKEKDKIVCLLCRHYCKLKEGQKGICGVNMNQNGSLKNLVYGKVAAINIDPIEKKPLYHFLPGSKALSIGSVGCNFKCPFCQNWSISQSKQISGYNLLPEQIVKLALENQCKSIAYTYNEPTIFWPFAKDIATLAKKYKIKGVFVSNGFESPEILEQMRGLIDGFNIDIKSFKKEYYKKSLKGDLQGVLDTLKTVKKLGFWLECTTLIVPGDNDSDEELREIANFIAKELGKDVPWHLSAFHPDYKVQDKPSTPPSTLIRAYKIAKEAGLEFVYFGNVAIKAITYCPRCNEELIIRNGYFIEKNILEDGKCPTCQEKIPGVWK
jgi:pyruvate formate lyase activating enzyme